MNKLPFFKLIVITALIGSTQFLPAAETPIPKKEESKTLGLPSDMWQEIISWLPITQAKTMQEYFVDLNNLRLTSRTAKEAVDKHIEAFLKKNNIAIPAALTPYQTFKKYIAATVFGNEVPDPELVQQQDTKIITALGGTEAIKRLIAQGGKVTENAIKEAKVKLATEIGAGAWLWAHRNLPEADPGIISKTKYTQNIEHLIGRAILRGSEEAVGPERLSSNDLFYIKFMLPIIEKQPLSQKNNYIKFATDNLNRIRNESYEKPEDADLKNELSVAEEILKLLEANSSM